jgi:dihydroorotate dehydrogenase (fumarate)
MDLSTTYLGLNLAHPVIVGAGPLSDDLDSVRRLEDAGAAMITLRSLFEEQITAEQLAMHTSTDAISDSHAESLSYLPSPDDFVLGPHEYLEHLRRVKASVGLPVVASLNGTTRGGWLDYARLIEQAGADALELNVYEVPTDLHRSGQSIEDELVELVRAIALQIRLPLAVKLSPHYTSLPNIAHRLQDAGAKALVLFNRFYQPDVDPEMLEATPVLKLSNPDELLSRLRWIVVLHGRVELDLVVTGGVHSHIDAIKAVMCGATAVQMVSALLTHGVSLLRSLIQSLSSWMDEHEYQSIAQMRGSMGLLRCPDPRIYERANYMRVLQG